MQYSLLYSSFQHCTTFFFLQNEIISTRKKGFKSFSLEKKTKWPPFQGHTCQIYFFEPYLINIRCTLSLKYVIQLEVP